MRLTIVIVLTILQLTGSAQTLEPLGPFTSWANIKQRFGAKGNGLNDDTKAFQKALDSFSNYITGYNMGSNRYAVLFIPAGTYLISSSLKLNGKIGISIVGEDPANTTIRWVGKKKDTILHANGSAYFKVSRLTFDGNSKEGMEGIGLHWRNRWDNKTSRSFAALNIEISDNYFVGLAVGIGGGTYPGEGTGHNDSEVAILRCKFVGSSDAGIKIRGFNALDYWIWDSHFLNCRVGVFNSHGNYHVYRSKFYSSSESDLYNVGGYYTSARDCYSSGSRAFSKDEGSSCNPFKRVFQSNTIEKPKSVPIEYYHRGNISLVNNTIERSTDSSITRHVSLGSWCAGNYLPLSIANNYSYQVPFYLEVPQKRVISIADKFRQKHDFKKPLESSVKASMQKHYTIFEVPIGASTELIQDIILRASEHTAEAAIVHFPFGTYHISRSLNIPRNSKIKIVGDGYIYGSMLILQNKQISAPLFVINGPSFVSFHDIHLEKGAGNPASNHAIEMNNIDQRGAMLSLDQIYSSSDSTVVVDQLNYLLIEKTNSFFSTGNILIGGKLQQRGKGTLEMNAFGGQFAGSSVQNNARIKARDCWWEGNERLGLNLIGSGSMLVDGAMMAPKNSDSLPTVKIGKFSGEVKLQNIYMYGGIFVDEINPNLKVLISNIHFYHKMAPFDFVTARSSFKLLATGITTQCVGSGQNCQNINSVPEKRINIPSEEQYLSSMISLPTNLYKSNPIASKSASKVSLTRVVLSEFSKGIVLKP